MSTNGMTTLDHLEGSWVQVTIFIDNDTTTLMGVYHGNLELTPDCKHRYNVDVLSFTITPDTDVEINRKHITIRSG